MFEMLLSFDFPKNINSRPIVRPNEKSPLSRTLITFKRDAYVTSPFGTRWYMMHTPKPVFHFPKTPFFNNWPVEKKITI